jgi:hypothetical protein
MIRTNESHLVEVAGLVEVHPLHHSQPLMVSSEGKPFSLPGWGGLVYNARVGDTAFGWMAEHLEPGVSAVNPVGDHNTALHHIVCVGNEAVIVSGDAKGDRGTVVGSHMTEPGGDHLIIDFARATLDKLVYGDKIMVRMIGKGMVFEDYPQIRTLCISPRLVKALELDGRGGTLKVPVAARAPAYLMGSGLGHTSERGDYDIMTADRKTLAELGLDKLRFGDIVALMDHDNSYGRAYRRGAVTIGVVGHGDSQLSGHGPGIVAMFTSAVPCIEPVIDGNANLAILFGLREDWKK